MKIVVLNECFFKKDHIERLKKIGELEIFKDTTTEQQVIERLKDAALVIADPFLTPLNKDVFEHIPTVKYITLNATGYDNVDIEAAKEKKIILSHIPGFSTEAVAEHAIALMFAVTRHIVELDKIVHKNPYEIDPTDISQLPFLGFNLKEKTLGVIGLGNIGQRIAEMANGIGMQVIGYSRSQKDISYVRQVALEELLRESDVISVNVSLNSETENLIGEKELSMLKPHAIIINTARGKVIDTVALANAIKNKRILGAGIDELTGWKKSNPLLTLENVVITPHSAWFTQESFNTMADMVVENIEAYASGEPQNLII